MFDPAFGATLVVSAAKLMPAPTPRDNTETVVRIGFRTFTSIGSALKKSLRYPANSAALEDVP
jgi:hypothetical protein